MSKVNAKGFSVVAQAPVYAAPQGEPGYNGRRPILEDPENLHKFDLAPHEGVKRNHNHCSLCRLRWREHIEKTQHLAGERLQDDYAKAGLSSIPSTLASLGSFGGGQKVAEIANMKFDADTRLQSARKAVGVSAWFLLEKIALEDLTAEQCAVILQQHKKAIIPSLRVALDALAAHYGMTRADDRRGGRIRAETIHPFQPEDTKCS